MPIFPTFIQTLQYEVKFPDRPGLLGAFSSNIVVGNQRTRRYTEDDLSLIG